MSSWLDGDSEGRSETKKYLKLGDVPEKGDVSKVRMRIIDEAPKSAFRHWINNRPYNCPGERGGCPVCPVRNHAMKANKEAGRTQYRMDKRWMINVIQLSETDKHGNETATPPEEANKVYSFGKEVGETLDYFLTEAQRATPSHDLRDIDVIVVKRRKGPHKLEITYTVERGQKYELPKEYAVLVDSRHDIAAEVAPASPEQIKKALEGGLPEESSATSSGPFNRVEALVKLRELAGEKNYEITDMFPGMSIDALSEEQITETLTLLERA